MWTVFKSAWTAVLSFMTFLKTLTNWRRARKAEKAVQETKNIVTTNNRSVDQTLKTTQSDLEKKFHASENMSDDALLERFSDGSA